VQQRRKLMKRLCAVTFFVLGSFGCFLEVESLIGPGDAAIVGISTSNNLVRILALRDWAPFDTLILTENPIRPDGHLGFIFVCDCWRYTVPTGGLAAGESILFNARFGNGWDELQGFLSLDDGGEEITLFTGNISSPNYVYALTTEDNFSFLSTVPPGLVEGNTAFSLNGDNAIYEDEGIFNTSELLSRIANRNFWRYEERGIHP